MSFMDEYKMEVVNRINELSPEEKDIIRTLPQTPIGKVLGKVLGPELGNVGEIANIAAPTPPAMEQQVRRTGLGSR
jgi:hypothetical protein